MTKTGIRNEPMAAHADETVALVTWMRVMDAGGSAGEGYHAAEWAVDTHKI
jgi:hypothetical protein